MLDQIAVVEQALEVTRSDLAKSLKRQEKLEGQVAKQEAAIAVLAEGGKKK